MAPKSKTVVILGAGWAGLPLAHKLLKYTAPKASIKVILVTPNTHFYWNVAATRGTIPNAIPDSDLFIPIAPAFKHHPASQFELVLGKAEAINPEENTVTIQLNDGSQRQQPFEHLVIATGSRISSGLPLKPLDSHEATLQSLNNLRASIDRAKTILVSGAGATGIEVAGELAAKYGSTKSITLVMSGTAPLDSVKGVLPSIQQTVVRDLKKLGIEVLSSTRVLDSTSTSINEDRQTTLTLSTGSTRTVDLYIPLHGIALNLSFAPSSFLDPSGAGLNLDAHMRVKGAKNNNIWGIGDVGNIEPKQLTVTDAQIIYLAKALHAELVDEEDRVEEYKPGDKTMVFVTLGKGYATGQIGGWRVWGWIVSWAKGRKLFVDTARGYVEGKHLRHAAM